jgi:hypothetical protein
MPGLRVRAAAPADRPALEVLERRHFPAKPGKPHSGFLFEDTPEARASLDENLAGPLHFFVSVAELDGNLEGFALALPFALPGPAQLDRTQGIGRALLEHIETRLKAARQNVVVAHIPTSATDFYREASWLVMGPTAGFAWLPFNDFLRADFPDPEIGYEHMAAKLLRPRAVRRWFGFPQMTNAPTADATLILEALIARGDVDRGDLDEGTLQMLTIGQWTRHQRPPGGL